MTRPVLLDNVAHHDLKLINHYGEAFGDNINQITIFPDEFADIQREYPIFFRPTETGAFQSIALLGLDRQENLFLQDAHWQARYIPAIRQRGPFMIGFQAQASDGHPETSAKTPVIHIDLDHPCLSRSEGEPLFLPHGGNAPCLERAAHALRLIHQGAETSPAMFAAFTDAGLMAPVAVDLVLADGSQYKLPELYTLSREALEQLEGAQLRQLNSAGFLAPAFHVIASLGNMRTLIDMKNRRLATA